MNTAFAIESDGVDLGVAVQDREIFRFHAAQADLFQLEKFVFVSLQDITRAARRAHASQREASNQRRSVEMPRSRALDRWRGLH